MTTFHLEGTDLCLSVRFLGKGFPTSDQILERIRNAVTAWRDETDAVSVAVAQPPKKRT